MGHDDSDKNFVVAVSLDELAKSKQVALRFQPVAKVKRKQMGRRSQEVRQFREERQKLEAEAAGPSVGAPLGTAMPVKVKLLRTPYVARAEAKSARMMLRPREAMRRNSISRSNRSQESLAAPPICPPSQSRGAGSHAPNGHRPSRVLSVRRLNRSHPSWRQSLNLPSSN